MHSVDNPEIHNDSEEGFRAISIFGFIEEVKGILIEKDII